ncbi:RNA-directed DNA polymerase from mobile element jockey [Caerostris extrusa]|uniref:RNA-directed DNA polymerase from mobile element jockey n=1 Tax=Caerostris extrusa TaxID=172846 RepID=A0AAV4SAV7_CAEEX|nr:RNA-directed DNA polymerase from mobile element jockey [Caerostris extrusa]
MGKIEKIYSSRDGASRVVQVRTSSGCLTRPIQKLYPLEVSTSGDPVLTRTTENSFHQLENLYQTAFSDHSLFPSNIDNSNDLETAVDNLTTDIITAYNLASKPLHNKSTYFLSPPIKRLIMQRNRARKNWQKYRDPFSKHLYNRAQAILRKEIKIYNESTWATELTAFNTEDSSLWITAKRFKKKCSSIPALTSNDLSPSTALTDSHKAELLADSKPGTIL